MAVSYIDLIDAYVPPKLRIIIALVNAALVWMLIDTISHTPFGVITLDLETKLLISLAVFVISLIKPVSVLILIILTLVLLRIIMKYFYF